jgi:hypothetical protein
MATTENELLRVVSAYLYDWHEVVDLLPLECRPAEAADSCEIMVCARNLAAHHAEGDVARIARFYSAAARRSTEIRSLAAAKFVPA